MTTVDVPALLPARLDALPEITAELAVTAPGYDRTGDFPAGAIEVVHRAGLLTATVAPRHGRSKGRRRYELWRRLLTDPQVGHAIADRVGSTCRMTVSRPSISISATCHQVS